MVMVFLIAANVDTPLAAGIAFIAYEVTTVLVATSFAARMNRRGLLPAVTRMVRIWIAALLMGGLVHWLFISGGAPQVSGGRLLLIVLTGMAAYPLAMLAICPRCLRDGLQLVRRG